jgi:hypothetical protein
MDMGVELFSIWREQRERATKLVQPRNSNDKRVAVPAYDSLIQLLAIGEDRGNDDALNADEAALSDHLATMADTDELLAHLGRSGFGGEGFDEWPVTSEPHAEP